MGLFVFALNARASEYNEIGQPITHVFGLKEHGGSDQNWYLTQAQNGLIYSGTGTGIVEWDGEIWHKYTTPNSSRIRSLSHWHDGHIYAGTIDNLGVYKPDTKGQLRFSSLIENWTTAERQFGEVWSTAANQDGVVFMTNKAVYFWDGNDVHIIDGAPGGKHRIFALDGDFIYKTLDSEIVYKINTDTSSNSPVFSIEDTQWQLSPKTFIRSVFYNRKNELVVVTSKDGVFVESNNTLVPKVDGLAFGDDVYLYNGIQASDGYYYLVSPIGGLFVFNESFQQLANYKEELSVTG